VDPDRKGSFFAENVGMALMTNLRGMKIGSVNRVGLLHISNDASVMEVE
jgi:hypothetical protein